MAIGAIISSGIGIVTDIFNRTKPSPAEQKAKAGVWYDMLRDWTKNTPSESTFISRWQSRLPFRQSGTKSNFMNNEIRSNTFEGVQDVLVGKINDELLKGGLPSLSKPEVLAGMNTGGQINASAVLPTTGSVTSGLDSLNPSMQDKNRNVFYVAGLAVIALIIGLVFRSK